MRVMQQSDSEDPQVSHRALFEDYLSCHVTLCPEPGPCRDEDILSRAAQVLLRHPVPVSECSATLVRLCHHVIKKILPTDPSHLPGLIRAAEILETLCLNLYLQPWRKEIRKLKSFTGAFVYCLLPALGRSTLQSILASIGYLPNEIGLPASEYRLSEDASPEGALQVAFQLLLTRALCLHLFQLQQHNRPEVQVCVERLQLKLPPVEQSQGSEGTGISTEVKEGNQTEGEEADTEAELNQAVCPEDAIASGLTEDQSIYNLQLTYPDLVFRGRPLRQEDDDHTPSQHTPLSHRRYAQRTRVPYKSTIKDIIEDEGLSGPLGLSLHITLRPQNIRLSPCTQQHPKTDMSCEENVDSPVKCEDDEVPKAEDAQACTQDHTTSIGTEDLHSTEESAALI
ncbi:hypothetical protein NL108_004826 [Boleophthalmus pectinirostris]|uniref:uncharacterized protein si:ch211-189a15.5 n=1 Tax=Boleophthalmus pectinirostris TaxID=150288 RepID=UPI002430DFE9|nr:uncharacterized protein si:ch211-189a15.5 [Boleophthalmus pectinirostris]KAJ0066864.1 hypothetical protein NL108_004826 [Boleophthalmus pectinirostris]